MVAEVPTYAKATSNQHDITLTKYYAPALKSNTPEANSVSKSNAEHIGHTFLPQNLLECGASASL